MISWLAVLLRLADVQEVGCERSETTIVVSCEEERDTRCDDFQQVLPCKSSLRVNDRTGRGCGLRLLSYRLQFQLFHGHDMLVRGPQDGKCRHDE
jgi:hypothetical protein